MRTNIDIDDDLLAEAMKLLGTPTKKATIEAALKRVVRDETLRAAIRDMKGLGWEGDLEALRGGWSPSESDPDDTAGSAAAE